MKKTKLLMPVLGLTATLGAVVPTVVACKSSEGNIQVDAVCKLDQQETEPDNVELISTKLPKASVEKDYVATIKWSHTDEKGKPVESHLKTSECVVQDSEGNDIVAEWSGTTELTETTYSTQLTIKKDALASIEKLDKIEITLIVMRKPAYDYSVGVQTPVDNLYGYTTDWGSQVKVHGWESAAFSCKTTDCYFGWEFDLGILQKVMVEKFGSEYSLVGATDLEVYIYNGGGVLTDRVVPTRVYKTTWNRTVSHITQTYVGDLYGSLTLHFDHELTEPELQEKQLIQGGFNIEGQILRNMQGAKVCVYDRRLIQE